MIQVRFTTSKFDADSGQWAELPVADLVADADELTITGPHPDWLSLTSRSSTPRPGSGSPARAALSAGHGSSRSPTERAISTSRSQRLLPPSRPARPRT